MWRLSHVSLAVISLCCLPTALATQFIRSDSIVSCAKNDVEASAFSVSAFSVIFTPSNHSLHVDIEAISAITGNVTADIHVTAYGYPVYNKMVNGCNIGLDGFCPLTSGNIPLHTNINDIDPKVISSIPSIAYSVPDVDGQVTIRILRTGTNDELACLQASLSNGKTVYHKGVGWASAVIAVLALLVSAVVAGLGHKSAAAHIAANTLSLFGFFQYQAIFGMTAIDLPPIVAAWTQNFQWTMGIIGINFVQDIATWYQRSTGGTPSNILNPLAASLVSVQKRSASLWDDRATKYLSKYVEPNFHLPHSNALVPRAQDLSGNVLDGNVTIIRGINRVGYRAGIEPTNIFMTGYIFFLVFVVLVLLLVLGFGLALELSQRSGGPRSLSSKFQELRTGRKIVVKGILLRIALIAFPQIVILCLWELIIARDSAAEIALAIITVLSLIGALGNACFKIARLSKRSKEMHGSPAYILYADPSVLHQWGFLYVQYKAACSWFTSAWLAFIFVLGLFIAAAQSETGAVVQGIAILILQALFLIGVCVLRPWMDKKTNAFNISIASVNFVSSIFLLFFTDIFGLPPLATGIMGVISFALNAIFALVLLIMVIIAAAYAIFSKNPEVRYQPMQDDRASFIRSTGTLTTELDALGATARGEGQHAREYYKGSESSSMIEATHETAAPITSERELNEKRPLVQDGSQRVQSYESERSQAYARRGQGTDELQYRGRHRPGQWQRGAGFD